MGLGLWAVLGAMGCDSDPVDTAPGGTAGGKADDAATMIACGDGAIDPSVEAIDPAALEGIEPVADLPLPSLQPDKDGFFHPPEGYSEAGRFATGTDEPAHQPDPDEIVDPAADGFVRVAVWNVERGANLDVAIARMKEVQADVWLVNEADLYGQKTHGKVAAREMARALGYAYYANTEFYELRDDRQGMSGNAILSRYPITDGQSMAIPIFEEDGGYDWATSDSEPRCGQRSALSAQIEVPNLGGTTTVVNFVSAHLENKTNRDVRRAQYEAARDSLSSPGEAVILGGDFNTWHLFEGRGFRNYLERALEAVGGTGTEGAARAFMDCSLGDGAGTHFIGRIDWLLLQRGDADEVTCPPGSYRVVDGPGSDHQIVLVDVPVR